MIECESCGSSLQIPEHLKSTLCPFCASPAVIERPPSPDRPLPTFALGFVLPKEEALKAMRQWLKRQGWFRRSGLDKAPVEAFQGVYLPAYLFGARAFTDYHAQIGEEYKRSDERRTEWRPLHGEHACYVRDIVVTASKGIPNRELEAIEPFDLRALRRYAPSIISGWLAEEPSRPPEDCENFAVAESLEDVRRRIERFLPGDKSRLLQVTPKLTDRTLDLMLLPLWVFALRFDPEKPPLRVLVNGQTGKVAGKVPKSPWKIFWVLLVVLLALLGAWLVGPKNG